ncbi:IniB N-terminal domain-containing protein [Amycolatopsis sp. lyj-112]|uniref:IniB N-terminal domain-containing protein n=1 Tax=Amycolatopsis sp. lyj-112 TaxID=2789288 RepID=UPI00397B01E0
MGSVQTLHDFTLNLLNDTAARVAFANDPQQVLADAGLGDINAADVHEVVPLVLDFVPVDAATGVTGTAASTADNLAGFGGVTNIVNGSDGECADGVQGAIDQLTALTAGLPVAVPAVGDLSGVPSLAGAGLPAVPAVPGLPELGLPEAGLPSLGDLPAGVPSLGDLPVDVPGVVPGLPGVPAVSDVTDVSNAAAGVTALAQNTVGSFGLTDDLSRGLDSGTFGQAGGVANGAVDTASGLVDDVPAVPAVDAVQVPALDSVPAVGDLNSDLPRADGVGGGVPDVLSQVGDLTSVIGNVGVADVTTKVHDVANNYANGDIANNHGDITGAVSGNVANEVANVANGAGVSEVHDVVSEAGNNIGHTIGNVGDVHLGAGDIGSGNDIHIG